jgi:hypothetical protein
MKLGRLHMEFVVWNELGTVPTMQQSSIVLKATSMGKEESERVLTACFGMILITEHRVC